MYVLMLSPVFKAPLGEVNLFISKGHVHKSTLALCLRPHGVHICTCRFRV